VQRPLQAAASSLRGRRGARHTRQMLIAIPAASAQTVWLSLLLKFALARPHSSADRAAAFCNHDRELAPAARAIAEEHSPRRNCPWSPLRNGQAPVGRSPGRASSLTRPSNRAADVVDRLCSGNDAAAASSTALRRSPRRSGSGPSCSRLPLAPVCNGRLRARSRSSRARYSLR
jgi:hypothetical protein